MDKYASLTQRNKDKLAARNKEQSGLKEKLETRHSSILPLDENVRQKLFDLAWSEGHAYGESAVAGHYVELAELVWLTWTIARD